MATLSGAATLAWPQSALLPSTPQPLIEEQRLREREQALREQNERSVDARLPQAAPVVAPRLPESETPCFRIQRIQLAGDHADAFPWVLNALSQGPDGQSDDPLGRCLGTEGVNTVLARAQQAVIARGYVTSRVLAGQQDLTAGVLTLTLIPGRIAAIRAAQPDTAPTATLNGAIPAAPGDLLNLRAVEQGLENLKRLPTVEADIQIAPAEASAAPGQSDLVVQYKQAFPLRLSASLDDSGTQATGKTVGGLTLAWDGPLHLNDLFYLSLNHDLFNHSGQGTQGGTVHYSIAWGDWLLGATASKSDYHQTVPGYSQDYLYAGESSNAELRLARLLYRDQDRKTSASVRAWGRSSRNFIDDTEIQVQHRITGGWEAALAHRELIALPAGQATLDANLAWRQGTGAFGSIPAQEEIWGEGTSRMQLALADVALNLPFAIGGQRLRYSGQWRAQWNQTPLTPQDRFSIGGRYTVRGFDGESSLMGEHGWLVRNDLGLALEGAPGAEMYLGLDYGHVGGPSAQFLLGTHLMGAVIGLRGAWRGLSYDIFIGGPLSKPDGFHTARASSGFNLNYSF